MSTQSNSDTTPTRPPDEERVAPKKIRRKKRRRSRIGKLYTKFRRHFRFGVAFIFIISVAAIGAMVVSVRISDASNRLDASWQRLERVLNTISERQGADITLEEFPRIRLGIDDLGSSIGSMQRQLRFIAPTFDLDINEEWEVASHLVDIASELTDATGYMLQGVAPIVSFLQQDDNSSALVAQVSDGEQIVDLFDINQASFRDASTALVQAQDLMAAIDLSVASPEQLISYQRLSFAHQKLSDLNSILLSTSGIFSRIMGLDQEVTYLLIIQNNDSMRPSGGEIEAYGWFTVRNGHITEFDFSASTFTSPVPPDPSFMNTFSIPNWWLAYESPLNAAWAGSWYTDFPSSAQMALDYYHAGGNYNSPVDGIIAIDFKSLQQIVGMLGIVDLTELTGPLTMANYRSIIYNPDNFEVRSQEDFVARVSKGIFGELQGINRSQSLELLTILAEGLTQHHIMVYLSDSEIQAIVDLLGWSGAQIDPMSDDYILVADTNLTNKSNYSIVRSSTYDVEIFPDQSRLSNLVVRYDYFDSLGTDDPAINPEFFGPRDYKTLTQIYLPDNSVILNENNTLESRFVDWENYKLFVTQLEVEYDSSEQFTISYETTPLANSENNIFRYRLLVEKQPGQQIQDLELKVKLPPNANILWVSHEPNAVYWIEQPIFDYRLRFSSDQWIEILYTLG